MFNEIIQRLQKNDPDLKHLDLTFVDENFDDENTDSELEFYRVFLDRTYLPRKKKFILNIASCYLLLDALKNNTYCDSMDCSQQKLGDDVIQLLAKIPNFKKLNLSNNQITDQGAQELAQSKTLRYLDLSENKIGFSGAESLSQNLYLDTLILGTQKLTGNKSFGDSVAIKFAQNSNIRHLDLTYWGIGIKGAKALSQKKFLNTLILNNNPITDAGAIYFIFSETANHFDIFFNMLKSRENINQKQMLQFFSRYSAANNNIKHLSLMNVTITDIGAFILAQSSILKTLNIDSNQLSVTCTNAFKHNQVLSTLKIGVNYMVSEIKKISDNDTDSSFNARTEFYPDRSSIQYFDSSAFLDSNNRHQSIIDFNLSAPDEAHYQTRANRNIDELSDNATQIFASHPSIDSLSIMHFHISKVGLEYLTKNSKLRALEISLSPYILAQQEVLCLFLNNKTLHKINIALSDIYFPYTPYGRYGKYGPSDAMKNAESNQIQIYKHIRKNYRDFVIKTTHNLFIILSCKNIPEHVLDIIFSYHVDKSFIELVSRVQNRARNLCFFLADNQICFQSNASVTLQR